MNKFHFSKVKYVNLTDKATLNISFPVKNQPPHSIMECKRQIKGKEKKKKKPVLFSFQVSLIQLFPGSSARVTSISWKSTPNHSSPEADSSHLSLSERADTIMSFSQCFLLHVS